MKPLMSINTIKDSLIVSFSSANLIKSLSFKKAFKNKYTNSIYFLYNIIQQLNIYLFLINNALKIKCNLFLSFDFIFTYFILAKTNYQ
jgi:hypothetical protein